MENPTSSDMAPHIGMPISLETGLRCILAPNASPMTHWGTNTYILGQDILGIIDPGPDDPHHLAAIMDAIGTARVSHIFVTHSHLDHSPLAPQLAAKTGAPVLGFGDSGSGRSKRMEKLAAIAPLGGGEGIDKAFKPDQVMLDRQSIKTPDWKLTAHHTPGHMGNHLAFEWEDRIFTGDLVMGWASTMVSPPDGDLTDFLNSCEKLLSLHATRLFPGHGSPITNPAERIKWLIAHRQERTDHILKLLSSGPMDVPMLTELIYHDATPGLLAAASRNVLAHLIDLENKGIVRAKPQLSPDAMFGLTDG